MVAGLPSNSENDAVAFPPLAGSSSNATDVDNPTAAFRMTGEVVGKQIARELEKDLSYFE